MPKRATKGPQTNKRQPKNQRGRPAKPGREIRITIRLREGEHDDILERLKRVPKGEMATYVRRVLAGATPDLLDEALRESEALTSSLDGILDDWDDE